MSVHVANDDPSIVILNDFLTLPIIISDYDGASDKRAATDNDVQSSSESSSRRDSFASRQKWKTGFADFADDLWNRMTVGMKQKLREACFEVLKRTDGSAGDEMTYMEYDDDARFLD